MSDLIARLDACIEEKSLLKHPFYQAWTRGELSVDALRDYAEQYYQHVKAFPTYLSALHAHTDDLEIRRLLTENLNDEEGQHPTHPELWLQFAEGLGMDRDKVTAAEANAYTRATIAGFKRLCAKKSVAEGLAALYAYESQIPEVSRTKIEGLKEWYGFTDERGWEYFSVHMEADVEHAEAERRMIESVAAEVSDDTIVAAADEALECINGLLDGIVEKHAIAC